MAILTSESLAKMLASPKPVGGKAASRASMWINPLSDAMERYDITTQKRVAAFLAQLLHESGRLLHLSENLNYSASALVTVWPRRFSSIEFAKQYERNPEKIANYVYSGRMGNEYPGDGWRYRGRGPIQITGKENYRKCGDSIGFDLISDPDAVSSPEIGALTAGWFWSVNSLNQLADKGDVIGITRRVNGGIHGLEERVNLYAAIREILKEDAIEDK